MNNLTDIQNEYYIGILLQVTFPIKISEIFLQGHLILAKIAVCPANYNMFLISYQIISLKIHKEKYNRVFESKY